jgi:thioredoxin-dependent peroxiredoxin
MRSLIYVFAGLTFLGCGKDPSSAKSSTTTAAAATPSSAEVAEGKPAPQVKARAHDGTEIDLAALKGKPVVLYFYPKDETAGCTKEACAFRDAWSDLAKTNVVLVGISTDSLDSHKQFAEHHKLPFHLISDTDGSIAKAYGVPNRAGFLGRQTFVIGADGNLKKIYRNVDVSTHAADVLAALKS